jgi:hypothetical protein
MEDREFGELEQSTRYSRLAFHHACVAFLDACIRELKEGLKEGLDPDACAEKFRDRVKNSAADGTCEAVCYTQFLECLNNATTPEEEQECEDQRVRCENECGGLVPTDAGLPQT